MPQYINHPTLPPPKGAYSHVSIANGFVFTAGVGPRDPETGRLPAGGIKEQTEQTMRTLVRVLEPTGASLGDAVRVTVHLANLARDFEEFDRAYGEFFPNERPVRTTVGSELSGILVEIDLIAALSS